MLSSDPIEFVDRPVPEKLDNSASIFPKLSSQNRTWCWTTLVCGARGAVTRSNSYPQFPRSPLVTPGTMIPLLARTLARLTTYCAGLCFKSWASKFVFMGNKFLLSTQKTRRKVLVTQNMCVCIAWVQQTCRTGLRRNSPHFLQTIAKLFSIWLCVYDSPQTSCHFYFDIASIVSNNLLPFDWRTLSNR